jgi:hypothetical protein
MGLAYNKLGFCEVGMHSNAPRHEFVVSVYEVFWGKTRTSDKSECRLKPFYTYNCGALSNADAPSRIRLDIVDPVAEYSPPKFFMEEEPGELYHLDFRRVVDYESEDFYNRKLRLKSSVFKPRLNITSGVFFTGNLSTHEYYRVAPNDPKFLGNVATLVAAGVYHEPDGYVALRIDKQELKLRPREDRIYAILFENLCPDNGNPLPNNGSIETDFDLYADTFVIPDDKELYRLISKDSPSLDMEFDEKLLKKEKPNERKPAPSQKKIEWLNFFEDITSSRDSPCGEAGFGKTDTGLAGS